MNYTIDITGIVICLVYIFIAVMTVIISKAVVPWLKSKMSERQFAVLAECAEAAVKCVQQTMKPACNTDKLMAAIAHTEKLLETRGITFDAEIITTEIEAMLKSLRMANGDVWYE